MQASVVKSFVPWIVYSIVVIFTADAQIYASLAALLSALLVNRWALKQGFYLDWATVVYFAALSVAFYFYPSPWLSAHAFFISNIALAGALWFSLLIRKPFTLQYAKLSTNKLYWEAPLFKAINFNISLMWCLLLTFIVIIGLSSVYFPKESIWYLDIVPVTLIMIGVLLTNKLPDWFIGRHFWRAVAKIPADPHNPFLQGNFAPVLRELDLTLLSVEGQLPSDLLGSYLRNGPNPRFTPISYTYPLDGDGMIHEVLFQPGKVYYRNRFVQTLGLKAELKAGKALYAGIRYPIPPDPRLIGKDGDSDPVKNGAFIHIIPFQQEYLALYESGPAYRLNTALKTLGLWQPNGKAIPVNAHTRVDPDTGDVYFICYHIDTSNLTGYRFDKSGVLKQEFTIAREHCAMVHDFVITQNYMIIFNCPAIFSLDALNHGLPLLSWQPDLGAQICLINREQPDKVQWLTTDAFFTFHFVNAYEESQQIIIDHIRHLEPLFMEDASKGVNSKPHLCRSIIDLTHLHTTHQQLSDLTCEFPRINDAYTGKKHRYSYMLAKLSENKSTAAVFDRLTQYDYETHTQITYVFGEAFEIGEAIFVPKTHMQAEDDGYIMLYVYHKVTAQSQLVIFEAKQLQAPIAKITMPARVPHGLHGSWVAAT